ncbi:hypothetical protein [Streptomyces milbemycinicus]|uniref:hypothetical protein n=1 Tax=Streptomyces milbemycinicus TaxID=476552 RepID=UPI001180B199|nr:hypothetical protein [Streptomyces milbemycinicus]
MPRAIEPSSRRSAVPNSALDPSGRVEAGSELPGDDAQQAGFGLGVQVAAAVGEGFDVPGWIGKDSPRNSDI